MNKLLRFSVLALGLMFTAGTAAHADPPEWSHSMHRDPAPAYAPEVDPNLALSGLALLGGTLTVLRARARK